MIKLSKDEFGGRITDTTQWVKPNRSGPVSDNCLEIADLGDGTWALRDSTNPGFGALVVNAAEMAAFVGSAIDGQYGHIA